MTAKRTAHRQLSLDIGSVTGRENAWRVSAVNGKLGEIPPALPASGALR